MGDSYRDQRRTRRDSSTRLTTYSAFADTIVLPTESRWVWIYGAGNLQVKLRDMDAFETLEIPAGNVLIRDPMAIKEIGSATTIPKIVVFS